MTPVSEGSLQGPFLVSIMPYFSLINHSSSDEDDDSSDSGQGMDCLPERKLPQLRLGSELSSSDFSSSSSGLGGQSFVKPTNYVSSGSSNVPQSASTIEAVIESVITQGMKLATDSSNDSPTKCSEPATGESGLAKVAGGTAVPWDSLLLGGTIETSCPEILTYVESDTYYEDCKLAGDVALNLLANYQMPVFNSLRNCNQNQVTSALKSLKKPRSGKKIFSPKEELLAYTIMLDYLTCCCQEGNLFPLYEKAKDYRKRNHIDKVDEDLGFLVDKLKSKIINLKQLHSLEQIVLSSLDRIPSSLKMSSSSVKLALQRKIKSFEEDEKNRLDKSEYTFDAESPEPPSKKWKPSVLISSKPKGNVVATSKNWREQTISPTFLPEAFQYEDSDDAHSTDTPVKTSTPKKENEFAPPTTISASDSSVGLMQKNILTSPYKSKKSTWNSSKYVSPSKQPLSKIIQVNKKVLDPRGDNMDNISRNLCLPKDKYVAKSSQAAATKYKSPLKAATQSFVRKLPGRSPLKVARRKGENARECDCITCRRVMWPYY